MRYIIIMFFLLLLISSSCSQNNSTEQEEANKIIAKIDSFKEVNRRVPNSLNEIGIFESEKGPIYYKKNDSLLYIVWYGTILGESFTYDSKYKKWE